MQRIALIGAGNMGNAMLSGWVSSGIPSEMIIIADKDSSKLEKLKKYNIKVAENNYEAVNGSDVIVLAVKPDDSLGVLEEIRDFLLQDCVLVSIVAALTTKKIREIIGSGPSVVRVMPNLAATVRASISAYSIDMGTREFPDEVLNLLHVMGDAIEVNESLMDIVTAISGSGPAYFFYMVEALQEAGRTLGMSPDIARTLARGTLWSAAAVLKETGKEAEDLRKAVSSPGGTTVAAIGEFEKAGLKGIVTSAVLAAKKRAAELSM